MYINIFMYFYRYCWRIKKGLLIKFIRIRAVSKRDFRINERHRVNKKSTLSYLQWLLQCTNTSIRLLIYQPGIEPIVWKGIWRWKGFSRQKPQNGHKHGIDTDCEKPTKPIVPTEKFVLAPGNRDRCKTKLLIILLTTKITIIIKHLWPENITVDGHQCQTIIITELFTFVRHFPA